MCGHLHPSLAESLPINQVFAETDNSGIDGEDRSDPALNHPNQGRGHATVRTLHSRIQFGRRSHADLQQNPEDSV